MQQTNWALVGTGGITNRFLIGLQAVEGANAYAAVSRSKEGADRFAAKYGIEKAYSDYDQMLDDTNVDVIYIGTPHTTHKDLCIRALRAKKAVLCEKPVSVNAREAAEMISCARENKVFFMEAMWTRFVPPLVKTREWLKTGLIGEVKMAEANFGFNCEWNPETRLLNPALGGGALLDAGIYPVSLSSMIFGGKKPEVTSQMYLGETGVDEEVSAVLSYNGRIATVSAAIRTAMVNDAYIYGTEGYIHLPNFIFSRDATLCVSGRDPYNYKPEFVSNGYNYEAEAVMNYIKEGKFESGIMGLDESLTIMQTLDTIREQGKLQYPGEEGDR